MNVGAWLDTREPAPPAELTERLRTVLGAALERDASGVPELFVDAAESLLAEMLEAGIERRESALDLLAVDALVTYAFEAAAENPASLRPRAQHAMERMQALAQRDA